MATFSAQVVDLVGTFTDETALDTFITEGANEVINAMPRAIMERVAEETAVTDGTTTSEGHKILHILRNDGTIDQPCRLVLASKRGRIQDSSDMEFATDTDPVYYIQDGKINIFPNGNGLMVSVPTYSQSAPLDASVISTITNFPDEYEYLVTLYAAIKALQQNMNSLHSNSDISTALTAINSEIDETLTIADSINTQIDAAVVEIAETVTNVDTSIDTALGAMTTAAGKINTATPSALVLEDLNITAVAPSVPSISTASYSDATNEDALIVGAIEVPSKIDISSNAPSFTKQTFATSVSKAISELSNEDIELVGAANDISQSQISEANLKLSNEQAEFNKENARYQMEFQEEVTRVNQEMQAELEKFRTEISLAQFNKQQDQSLNLQNAAKQLEDIIADNNNKLQKFSTELNKFSLEVNKDISEYQQNLNQKLQEFQSSISITGVAVSEVQAYGNEVAQRLAQVGAQGGVASGYINAATGYANEIQSKLSIASAYGNEIQLRLNVDGTEYGWYQQQQAKLQADYDKGIQIMRG